VLMIASLGRPASDFDELSATLVVAGYSTIRPQPRGIGGSTGPMNGLSLRDLAADAMAAADNGPIIVLGHDFGQRVARMVAALYPDRVESVVMLGAGGKVPMRPGAGEALGRCLTPPCRQTNTWTRCASLSSLRAMILRSGATICRLFNIR
jgi:pimeloyl-ACP methyl ester carboxylesterase